MKNNVWKFNAIIFYDNYVRNVTKECANYDEFVVYILGLINDEINIPFPNLPTHMYVYNDHSKKYYLFYINNEWVRAYSLDMPTIKLKRKV